MQAAAFVLQMPRFEFALLNSFRNPFSKIFTSFRLNESVKPTPWFA